MDHQSAQPLRAPVWQLAARQHGVVARRQLLALGLSADAIKHRVASGRFHPVRAGVYAVGRPQLSRFGVWMAAVLCCGPRAVLSHASAAALWEVDREQPERLELSVPLPLQRRRPGIVIHRRALGARDVTVRRGIPVTTPACTLVDVAARFDAARLEAAVNAADRLDLIDPERLRAALTALAGRPGVAALRALLDRRTFTLTDSELERRFLPLARRAGLPRPLTRVRVSGFLVDFFWPELGLVVETDGLRYHRTPSAQARDRLRDQAHAAAGLTPLRFTHAQVRYEPEQVVRTLSAVGRTRPP